MRAGSLAGAFSGFATISSLGLGVRGNRFFNLLKPGKTNGAAAVDLLSALLLPAGKRVLVSNRRLAERHPSLGEGVDIVARRCSVHRSVGVSRVVRCRNHLCFVPEGRVGREARRLLRFYSLLGFHGHAIHGLSNKVGHGLVIYQTLLASPRVLLLSRPATNVSTLSEERV